MAQSMINKRIQRMQDFITAYKKFKKTITSQDNTAVNVFRVINMGNDEVMHSSFLAWLLDANANHQQGTLFFNTFLKLCKIDLPLDILTGYSVRTEITGPESIIDILVYKKHDFLIYVENKVDSAEGIEQCNREFRDMHHRGKRLNIPLKRRYAVFLTPYGRDPVTGNRNDWRTLSYYDLRLSYKQLIPQITLDKVKYILEDWMEIIYEF